MALCYEHAQKHLPYIDHITTLILSGETLKANDKAQTPPDSGTKDHE